MTWEAVHVQFPMRKLIFTIIPIAREGSISVQNSMTKLLLRLCKSQVGEKVPVKLFEAKIMTLCYIYIYSFSRRFYPKWLTIEEYNKRYIIKRQTDAWVLVIQIYRHCSEQILARQWQAKGKRVKLRKKSECIIVLVLWTPQPLY